MCNTSQPTDPPGCSRCNGVVAVTLHGRSGQNGYREHNIAWFLPEKSLDRESYNISGNP